MATALRKCAEISFESIFAIVTFASWLFAKISIFSTLALAICNDILGICHIVLIKLKKKTYAWSFCGYKVDLEQVQNILVWSKCFLTIPKSDLLNFDFWTFSKSIWNPKIFGPIQDNYGPIDDWSTYFKNWQFKKRPSFNVVFLNVSGR